MADKEQGGRYGSAQSQPQCARSRMLLERFGWSCAGNGEPSENLGEGEVTRGEKGRVKLSKPCFKQAHEVSAAT